MTTIVTLTVEVTVPDGTTWGSWSVEDLVSHEVESVIEINTEWSAEATVAHVSTEF